MIDLSPGDLLYYGGVEWLNIADFLGKIKKVNLNFKIKKRLPSFLSSVQDIRFGHHCIVGFRLWTKFNSNLFRLKILVSCNLKKIKKCKLHCFLYSLV